MLNEKIVMSFEIDTKHILTAFCNLSGFLYSDLFTFFLLVQSYLKSHFDDTQCSIAKYLRIL